MPYRPLLYGTAYSYSSPTGNFEGTWAFSPDDGSIIWVNDCHGDTYSSFPIGGVLYSVSHAHDCSAIGGFPDGGANRAIAQSTTPSSTYNRGPDSYGWNYSAYHDSALLTWFPSLRAGTVTGQTQAAWSVTGNASYVAMGGEFPTVNGSAQQGLVRFAVSSVAPNKVGPTYNKKSFPTVSYAGTSATLQWGASIDLDNENLTYQVLRDTAATPVYTTTQSSTFWRLPALSYTDTGLASGYQPNYRVVVSDPFGNKASYPQPWDDTSTRWTYSGSWSAQTATSTDDYRNTTHTTSTVGSSASFTFTGTGVNVYVERNPNGGTATVAVDGVTKTTASTAGTTAAGLIALGATSLANGTHTVTVTLTAGTSLALDAVSYNGVGVQGPPPVDTSAAIIGNKGLCVGTLNRGSKSGTPTEVATCTGAADQRWAVGTKNTLRSQGNCLDVKGGATASSTPVQIATCNGTGSQVWQYQADRQLYNPQSRKCLNIKGGGGAGTPLIIYACQGSANELWTLPR